MRISLPFAFVLATISVGANAEPIRFSGSGTITNVLGPLQSSTATPLGSPVSFSFSFDPDKAVLYEQADGEAAYDLSIADFNAKLGSYDFPLSADPAFAPGLVLSRGFTFLDQGQPFSEPVLIASFYFATPRLDAPSTSTPFPLSAQSYGVLSIDAYFRDASTSPTVTIADLRDPAEAARRSLTYSARDVDSSRRGVLQGSYVGGFAAAGGVPEPASWALMILGFGAVGGAMRFGRRSGRISLA